MTLAELWMEVRAHRAIVQDANEAEIRQAWWHANIQRDAKGKLKPLKDYLPVKTRRGAQSTRQLKTALSVMSGQYGIPLRRGGKVIH